MIRLQIPYLAVLMMLTISIQGCPDPQKDFDAYLERVEMVPTPEIPVPVSGCGPVAEDPSGTYLASVNTNLAPGLPLLFEGQFTVDMAAQPKTAQLTLIPISVAEKIPVEDLPNRTGDVPVVSPTVEIDDEGKFVMPLGSVFVTGAANPVTGSDIEVELQIEGQILSGQFICGQVTGQLIQPSAFDLGNPTTQAPNGSTFALQPTCNQAYADLEPLVECQSCEDVAALECGAASGNGNANDANLGRDSGDTGDANTAGTAGDSGNASDGTDDTSTAGTSGDEAGEAGNTPTAGASGNESDDTSTAGAPSNETGEAGEAQTAGTSGDEAGEAGDANAAGTADDSGNASDGTDDAQTAGTSGDEAGEAGNTSTAGASGSESDDTSTAGASGDEAGEAGNTPTAGASGSESDDTSTAGTSGGEAGEAGNTPTAGASGNEADDTSTAGASGNESG